MNYRGTDPDITQPNLPVPKCCIPECTVVEPGVGVSTCVAWGKRLCYGPHFDAFAASELSWACSDRGKGPSDIEWKSFLVALAAQPDAKRRVGNGEVATHLQNLKGEAA